MSADDVIRATHCRRGFYKALLLESHVLILAGAFSLTNMSSLSLAQGPTSRFTLTVTAVDDESSKPIRMATVRVIDPLGRTTDKHLSDEQGKAAFLIDLDVGPLANNLSNAAQSSLLAWRAEASAPGLEPTLRPLSECHTMAFQGSREVITTLEIRLTRRALLNSEQLLVGEYVHATIGREFSLLLDKEKFEALVRCPQICSHHVPWYEVYSGDWSLDHATVTLKTHSSETLPPNDPRHVRWFGPGILHVKWGERNYLVPEDRLLGFCNAVNQGIEPRRRIDGDFYLRRGDESKSAIGLPTIPSQWREYLLSKPLRGHVFHVFADGSSAVSLGHKSGLRRGMELLAAESGAFHAQTVVSVDEQSAIVVPKYPNSRLRRVRPGDELTTR
jgi:hypothetical protein